MKGREQLSQRIDGDLGIGGTLLNSGMLWVGKNNCVMFNEQLCCNLRGILGYYNKDLSPSF